MILEGIKASLVQRMPYFAAAVWRIPIRETRAVPVAAADRFGRIYFNPEWLQGQVYPGGKLDQQGAEEALGVYLHEIYHLLLKHWVRSERFFGHPLEAHEAEVWNLGADMEINTILRAAGMALPDNSVFPESFGLSDGHTAEWYTAALMQQAGIEPPQGSGRNSRKESQAGEEEVSSSRGAETSGAAGQKRAASGQSSSASGKAEETGAGEGEKADSTNGSAADGRPRPWEEGPESEAAPAPSPEEVEAVRRQVAIALRDAVKEIGKLPAGLRRMVEEYGPPRVPWEDELYALVQGSLAMRMGASDYTWQRFSRRSAPDKGYFLPRLIGPNPRVGVVLDTSGSMEDAEISEALGEVQGILQVVDGEIAWYATDAKVASWGRSRHVADITVAGGGGTNIGVGIRAALDDAAEVVVVFTDGYTPWPTEEPEVPVVVVLVGDRVASEKSVPEWAAVVRIPKEAAGV